jgi:hypothetical protein
LSTVLIRIDPSQGPPFSPPPAGDETRSYQEYVTERLGDGVDNCVLLLRELRSRGYGEHGSTDAEAFIATIAARQTALMRL